MCWLTGCMIANMDKILHCLGSTLKFYLFKRGWMGGPEFGIK